MSRWSADAHTCGRRAAPWTCSRRRRRGCRSGIRSRRRRRRRTCRSASGTARASGARRAPSVCRRGRRSPETTRPSVSERLLSLLGRRFDDEHAGKLVLWHGAPGTGKTHALRAFAWEWRSWCSLHYITDPEEFVDSPRYMLKVLLDGEHDESGWRLLILEDTGELLALDAKYRAGQGLSRFLNVVDGLIGQGLRVVVLVTTNETLRSLDPDGLAAGAVCRSGRVHGLSGRGGRCVARAPRPDRQRIGTDARIALRQPGRPGGRGKASAGLHRLNDRRRGLRHRDAAADLRLRPRRPLTWRRAPRASSRQERRGRCISICTRTSSGSCVRVRCGRSARRR